MNTPSGHFWTDSANLDQIDPVTQKLGDRIDLVTLDQSLMAEFPATVLIRHSFLKMLCEGQYDQINS